MESILIVRQRARSDIYRREPLRCCVYVVRDIYSTVESHCYFPLLLPAGSAAMVALACDQLRNIFESC
jgi:hypothetical protein